MHFAGARERDPVSDNPPSGSQTTGDSAAPSSAVVIDKEWLTPAMARIWLDGSDGFAPIEATEGYLKCFFVPPGAPYAVPWGPECDSAAPELRPRSRRLTVRCWDPDAQVFAIDVLTHSGAGYAGRWAEQAEPGDVLYFQGPSGKYRPDPDADWHLFAGDESALPAIAASLEAVPEGRPCVALVVVDSEAHEIELLSPGEVQAIWLHRDRAAAPERLLASAVEALEWHPGRVDVFLHGEAGEVRATRKHLVAGRGVDHREASISPYWRRDHDDEQWRAVKRQWLAEQELDN